MYSNSSDEHHPLVDWLRLFKKAEPFPEEVFNYLKGPISFPDENGKPIHIHITAIEHTSHRFGDELRFQFSEGDEQSRREESPQMQSFQSGRKMHVSLRPGQVYTYPPLFWYTFSSQSSLNENRRNLRDFVLSQHHHAAVPPRIESERISQ